MEKVSQQFMTGDPFYYGILKEFAKENRKFMTDAERELWMRLKGSQLGLPFRTQHVIVRYIADFVCLQRKLVIEIDGGYHAQEQQKIEDYLRTEDLEAMGFRVIRFKNEEIHKNISNVLDTIFNNLYKFRKFFSWDF